ncbi:hypothetical protein GCM10027360_13850 [Amycolatopsis echigonensis]
MRTGCGSGGSPAEADAELAGAEDDGVSFAGLDGWQPASRTRAGARTRSRRMAGTVNHAR